jgi:hypothetical protein
MERKLFTGYSQAEVREDEHENEEEGRGAMCLRLLEQRNNRNFETGEEFGCGSLARGAAHHELVPPVLEVQDLDGLCLRIDDPILLYAVLFVEITLLNAIALTIAERNNFDRQVGGSVNHFGDNSQPRLRNEDDIGLGHSMRRQNHVDRSG